MESSPMMCRNCGAENSANAVYCQICGHALQKLSAPHTELIYAGFWQRFAALLIDAAVISVGTGILVAISFGAGGIAVLFGPWIYEAAMLSSEWQATIGKRVMSITVSGMDGGRISFTRATGRHFAKYVSTLILFVGFIMAAFTQRKQALHDLMAGTLVVVKTL
jgi:uncharacterized RDD family membrane protein YckC